jgi:sugar fermentation stimulation protein A
MRFQTPLKPAVLLRRYKRFLADVRLESGEEVTAHCPNPGAMLGLDAPGSRIWVEPNDNPRRKLDYAWRLSRMPDGGWVGIDTSLPNRLVAEALREGAIPELSDYSEIRPEQRYGEKSRVDFLLRQKGLPDLYLEVKNAHLCRQPGLAEFPDCVTARGARHLQDLAQMVAQGHRAVLLFVVQRDDCQRFAVAADLDPAYGRAYDAARAAGVEVLCYDTRIAPERLVLGAPLPLEAPRCEGAGDSS